MAWLMERKKVGAWHMSAQQVWWVLSGCQTCQALGGTFKGGEVPLEVVVNQVLGNTLGSPSLPSQPSALATWTQRGH